jgi:hypothetical protein
MAKSREMALVVLLSILLLIALQLPRRSSPPVTSSSAKSNSTTTAEERRSQEASQDKNVFCLASVKTSSILAVSVVDEHGRLNFSLPSSFDGAATVDCTRYNLSTGVAIANYSEIINVSGSAYQECPQKGQFQPGYWDRASKTWKEPCKENRGWGMRGDKLVGCSGLEKQHEKNQTNGVWVSVIGDSVIRDIFYRFPFGKKIRGWHTGRNSIYMDYAVRRIPAAFEAWMTFSWLLSKDGSNKTSWGDFVKMRKEPSHKTLDPSWDGSKVPDIVVFTLGYHGSSLSVKEWENLLEGILREFEEKRTPHQLVYYMTNIMPNPNLIPEGYSKDRPLRTFLREYAKNRAVLEVVAKFDFVKIIDLFSVELPFNDVGRLDAVHVSGDVSNLLRDKIMDSVCSL